MPGPSAGQTSEASDHLPPRTFRESARAWIERARAVTFRRLEEDTEAAPMEVLAFRAPPAVAEFFLRMLAAGSPDLPWSRTTLCAWHHERALHRERTLRIRGRAPDALVFALGPAPAERYASGDLRLLPDALR